MMCTVLWRTLYSVAIALLVASTSLAARDVSRYPMEHPGFSANIVASYSFDFKGFLPLEIQLGIDPEFSVEQQKLIKGAVKLFVERATQDRIILCALEKASKDGPESMSKFQSQLLAAMSLIQREDMTVPSFVFVAKYWGDSKFVGLGYQGLFYERDWPFPGFDHRHYLHIALNSDFLGEPSSYLYRNDVEYWSGVIAHEVLHNLGYGHPKGYERSFIYEYGNCVRTNGLEALPLEGEVLDLVVEKDL